jgi:TPP-dependent pyruvate/acetoin dehydrogenase alpha subunit
VTNHQTISQEGAESAEPKPSDALPSASSATSCKKDWLIAFEDKIKSHWESGALPCLLHLCGGNEDQLLEIFTHIRPGDWVFSTHRNHYHALLCGMPEAELEAAILAGRSMFAFRRARMQPGHDPAKDLMWDGANLYSSAILAGTCGIAAGVAYACRPMHHDKAHLAPRVWCFLGDGAEEEGHFYEAALFVEANNLPCTFIIEDNDRQVDTPRSERRGPEQDYCEVDWRKPPHKPLDHFKCVQRYHYTPTYPHAGSGCKFQITFKPEAIDRLKKAAQTG